LWQHILNDQEFPERMIAEKDESIPLIRGHIIHKSARTLGDSSPQPINQIELVFQRIQLLESAAPAIKSLQQAAHKQTTPYLVGEETRQIFNRLDEKIQKDVLAVAALTNTIRRESASSVRTAVKDTSHQLTSDTRETQLAQLHSQISTLQKSPSLSERIAATLGSFKQDPVATSGFLAARAVSTAVQDLVNPFQAAGKIAQAGNNFFKEFLGNRSH
jgi:hypothetical protein